MKDNTKEINLSIIDVERRYMTDPIEVISNTGDDKPVMWGIDNQLPNLYKSCYLKSSTLKATVDSAVNYVLGDDVIVSPEAAKWNQTVNRNGMTMKDLIEVLAFNLFVFNGYAFQVVYNKLGTPVEMFPLDLSRIRTNKYHTKIYFNKKEWTKYVGKYDEYDAYNPEKIDPEHPTQIYFYKANSFNSVYPIPMYNGALNDILVEMEASRYSLNTVSNGFAAKYIFNFPTTNNLTDEQKQAVNDGIRTKFCGSDAVANYMLYWKNDEEKGLEVTKLETDDTSEKYIAIKDSCRQNIFISMRTTPLLCGLPNASNGFSTNEYRDSYKLYDRSVIAPARKTILNGINKVIGIPDAVKIAPFTISFDDNNETN